MSKLRVIKIGGNVVDNPEKLDKFITDVASLGGLRILVHGGGKIATQISKSLGIEPQMVDGRRITDAETLKVVTMVYAGLVNKTIVSKLQAQGCNAVGLSGADGRFIISKKRASGTIDYGYVGDPETEKFGFNIADTLISKGYFIISAPITMSENGDLLNTNADTVAQTVAIAMATKYEVELIYCFEKNGVLSDVNDDNSVIKEINYSYYDELKNKGVIADGMIPKLDNAFKAINSGVSSVRICNSDDIKKVENSGTLLIK